MRAVAGAHSAVGEADEEEEDANTPVDKDGTILASDPLKPM